MHRDLRLYLEDIRDAIAAIHSHVGERSFEEVAEDQMTQLISKH